MTIIPIAVFAFGLLLYITFEPFIAGLKHYNVSPLHSERQPLVLTLEKPVYERIAVTVDFSYMDAAYINHALAQEGKAGNYLLIHIVETAGAMGFGEDIKDHETQLDKEYLDEYRDKLLDEGYKCLVKIGFGDPKQQITLIVEKFKANLLAMGGHGHTALKDWFFGTTVSAVRPKLAIPMLIVRKNGQ